MNRIHSTAIYLLAVAFLALVPAAASAQAKLDAIVASGKLRVGIPGDYRPFALRDKATDKVDGFDIEMAESLAASLGVKVEIVPTKWGDLLPDLAAEKFDIAMGGVSITLARQKSAFFSSPVVRTGKSAVARCADASKYQSLAAIDQPGVKVVVNPGGTNEKFDRANLKQAAIVMHPDNTTIFEEVAAGRADVMITDSVEARLQQKLNPQLCAIRPEAPFDFGEIGYMLPRDAGWKMYVDQWLHILAETGGMKTRLDKWLK